MTAPKEVKDLVERFDRNIEAYKSGKYNETQLRREFVDPLFKALGWDLDNEQGNAEAYKDVVHEDSIKIAGGTKAPDYCFRIGGQRKFFVEAKKPSINIKNEPGAAYQIRRYAWSAKLLLSILTDFEEFAVYDCLVKPNKYDSASVARVRYYNYKDYIEQWDKIASVFSKDAIYKGSFDKYAVSGKKKRGTTEVDNVFLKEIEKWRESLAKNIAVNNTGISQEDLNFAVQKTIDRIIFLRICEDRHIEEYGRLMALQNGSQVYGRLCQMFKQADDKYNSGLFHFNEEKERPEHYDGISLKLKIDDKTLKDVIKGIYYPESPYEFSVLPADILGHVYEQFLGKVIRLTAGHRAVIEEKPEVRKAGGIYYTPTYIVDYIVKSTVGKLLEDKTPEKVSKLRILDPACGSGSFLIQAYQRLLDWHMNYYVKNDPLKHAKKKNASLFRDSRGEWTLTTSEKKRILLNNIYGVDIDSQAVEVTKLSLLLKVLEGETDQTINSNLRLFNERALPDLGSNIKFGNSLIGSDFYRDKNLSLFGNEEMSKINAFDWNDKEKGFGEIMASGGFDAVIGNPPYIRIQGFPKDQIDYLTVSYRSATGNCDLYVSFVERGYALLVKNGLLGYIVPNKFFRTDYGEGLRCLLSDMKAVDKIIDFKDNQVFSATTYTCLLFLQKGGTDSFHYAVANANPESLLSVNFINRGSKMIDSNAWTFEDKETSSLLAKIEKGSKHLLDLPAEMNRGSSTGDDEVFIYEAGTIDIEDKINRVPLFASDFNRYKFAPKRKWKIIFPYVMEEGKFRLYTENELKKKYPKAFAYLQSNQNALKKRKQYQEWYGYSAPRNLDLHENADIAIPLLANKGIFAIIPSVMRGKLCPMASGGFTLTISKECKIRPEYVIGLLNSKLLFWRLRTLSNLFREGWVTCTKQYFGQLPIHLIDFSNPTDKALSDKCVKLVDEMTETQENYLFAKTESDKAHYQQKIELLDKQIDALVYELYGLTEKEIKLVEGETEVRNK